MRFRELPFKSKLKAIFIMYPLQGVYYILAPFVLLQNKVVEKYNELDKKFAEELRK